MTGFIRVCWGHVNMTSNNVCNKNHAEIKWSQYYREMITWMGCEARLQSCLPPWSQYTILLSTGDQKATSQSIDRPHNHNTRRENNYNNHEGNMYHSDMSIHISPRHTLAACKKMRDAENNLICKGSTTANQSTIRTSVAHRWQQQKLAAGRREWNSKAAWAATLSHTHTNWTKARHTC